MVKWNDNYTYLTMTREDLQIESPWIIRYYDRSSNYTEVKFKPKTSIFGFEALIYHGYHGNHGKFFGKYQSYKTSRGNLSKT